MRVVQAKDSKTPSVGDGVVRLVVVEVDRRRYGLPIEQVVEMVRMVAITPLPHSPDWMPGVINLRGQTVPVIDLRARFGLAARAFGLDTPLCIVQVFDRAVALVADAAVEVIELSHGALDEPDEITGRDHPVSTVARAEGRLIPVLELERICDGAQALATPLDDYDAA